MKVMWWAALLASLLSSESAGAVMVSDPAAPPPLDEYALLISAFSVDETVRFVELHNRSDMPVELDGWTVVIGYMEEVEGEPLAGERRIEVVADGVLLPDSYVTLGREDAVSGQSFSWTGNESPYSLLSLTLQGPERSLTVDTTGISQFPYWYQRRTGDDGLRGSLGDFIRRSAATAEAPRDSGLYVMPEELAGVRVVEVYARASDCPPDQYDDVLCGDYIKLQNTTSGPVDLRPYRLRTDSGGEAGGIGNTLSLAGYGSLDAGEYVTLSLRDDGEDLSLTDAGGYIWLEDAAGISGPYVTTVTSYPSVGSTKQGWSWAYDAGQDAWRWTMSPQPAGANVFAVPQTPPVVSTASRLVPCAANQYRNPETNRCKRKEPAQVSPSPCAAGQERNPATNRCRRIVTATSSFVPCQAGQERNPATNRCRSIAAAAVQYKPCAAGQERNPATNRCRKIPNPVTGVASTVDAISPMTPSAELPVGPIVLGVSGVAALSYGVYEWRVELRQWGRRIFGVMARR